MKRLLSSVGGTSIAEILVASAIGSVFAVSGWSFQRFQSIDLANQTVALGATERLRGAMTFVARELRQAGGDPTGLAFTASGQKGISDARAESVSLQYDRNGSGAIEPEAADPLAESITYAYETAGRRIVRTVAGSSQTFVTNVPAGGLSFEYFDGSGNPLSPSGNPAALTAAQRDAVATVRITLRVDAAAASASSRFAMTHQFTLRNRVRDRL